MVLQMVIGIDKRNPLFTICYGGLLYEVIEDKKDNPELKLMLVRLYNAGVSEKNGKSINKHSFRVINEKKRNPYNIPSGTSRRLHY